MEDDIIIDIYYTTDNKREEQYPTKHPRNASGHFEVTSPSTKKKWALKRGAKAPKGKALRPFRSKNRKPSPHENPSGPGRERTGEPT